MYRKIIIEGRLTRDPDFRTTTNQNSVCNFSIASQRDYKSGDDYTTDFFDVVVWKNRAEQAAKCLKKGMHVFIIGDVENSSYVDSKQVKREKTVIVADTIRLAGFMKAATEPTTENAHFDNSGGDFVPDFTEVESYSDLPFSDNYAAFK